MCYLKYFYKKKMNLTPKVLNLRFFRPLKQSHCEAISIHQYGGRQTSFHSGPDNLQNGERGPHNHSMQYLQATKALGNKTKKYACHSNYYDGVPSQRAVVARTRDVSVKYFNCFITKFFLKYFNTKQYKKTNCRWDCLS